MTPTGNCRPACYGLAMRRSHTASLLALTALTLAACAKDAGTYPSLARRPAERVSGTAPVVSPAPEATPMPPPPELLDRLDRLVAEARSADARFRQNSPRTRALVSAASNAAIASESWAVATVALADLESQRSQAMIALADLDALYAAAAVAGSDSSAVARAREQVIAMVGEEDAVLSELKSQLAS